MVFTKNKDTENLQFFVSHPAPVSLLTNSNLTLNFTSTNSEAVLLCVDFSLPSERVIRSLEQIIEWRGKPCCIRCDNEPEYISEKITEWAVKRNIELRYIEPGKPTQNAFIERFNRTARHEWLNMYLFENIEQAQMLGTKWLWTYNNERPNTAIGGIPPRMLSGVA